MRASALPASALIAIDASKVSLPADGVAAGADCGLVVDGTGVGRGAQVGTFAFYPRIPIAISHSFEKSIPTPGAVRSV